MNKPEPGDRVIVQDSIQGELSGEVVDLLSVQFTYWTGEVLRFAFYNDEWSIEQ